MTVRFLVIFFGVADVSGLEKQLVGKRYDANELARVLESAELKAYFGSISKEEFLSLIY